MLAVQVSYLNVLEQRKANAETLRHNRETERQQDINLALTERNIAETERANRAHEDISIQNLYETTRHNKAQEAIGRTQAAASLQQAQVRQSELAFEKQKYNDYGKTINMLSADKLYWEGQTSKINKKYAELKNVTQIINDIVPF